MDIGLLKNLLQRNSIEEEVFARVVYNTLLNSVFETICKEIKRRGKKTEELARFRKTKDHILVTKGIVARYVGCALEDEEYERIYKMLRAFFNKKGKDNRIAYPDGFKIRLLKEQKEVCPYCGKQIDLSNSHLDHIIPWDYVGDELDNNYQMLCTRCNEQKGTSSYFELSMLLRKVENV